MQRSDSRRKRLSSKIIGTLDQTVLSGVVWLGARGSHRAHAGRRPPQVYAEPARVGRHLFERQDAFRVAPDAFGEALLDRDTCQLSAAAPVAVDRRRRLAPSAAKGGGARAEDGTAMASSQRAGASGSLPVRSASGATSTERCAPRTTCAAVPGA
jgi:hypothetical protein